MSDIGVRNPLSPYRMPDRDDAAFETFIEKIGTYLDSRAAETQLGFAEISTYELEQAYNANALANSTLTVQPKTTNLVLVEMVIASIPTGAAGVLTLGDAIIPLPGGVTPLPGLRILLEQTAVRSLTTSTAGQVALVVQGRQKSARSLLR